MSLARRLVVMLAAYLAAALAASLLLNVVIPVAATWPDPELGFGPAAFLRNALLGAATTAALAALPSVPFVAWAEWRGQRRPSFFAVSGAASALLTLAALERGAIIGQVSANQTVTGLLALGGAVAGLVYWALAGRVAGAWRSASTTAPAPTGS